MIFFKSTTSDGVQGTTKSLSAHTVQASKSFNCEDNVGELFQAMFLDSKIAQGFSCAHGKQTYLLQYAIHSHLTKCLEDRLNDKFFSLSFDEADGRLAVVIRYFDHGEIFVDLLDLIKLDLLNLIDSVNNLLRTLSLCYEYVVY